MRKATIRFVMSVRPSVRMEQLGSHWMDFHEIWYLLIFRKYVAKIQVSLKSDNCHWYFTWGPIYIFFIISRSILLGMRNVSDKSWRENQNTRSVFSNSPPPENRSVFEVTWKNIVEPERPRMKIWSMRFAEHLRLQTHTLKICNTYCFSTVTVVTPTLLSGTLYIHCLFCFFSGLLRRRL